jgi:hypothetical protein
MSDAEAVPQEWLDHQDLLAVDPAARRNLALASPTWFDTHYCGMRWAEHRERWLNDVMGQFVEAQAAQAEAVERAYLRKDDEEKQFEPAADPGMVTARDTRRKLLLLGPRKHGKTELAITIASLLICWNRNIRILLVCESEGMAKKRLGKIKRQLLTERIQADWCTAPDEGFGPFLNKTRSREDPTKWDETEIRVLRDVDHVDSTVMAVGTGTAMVGGHYDVIILDDPESNDTVMSPLKRARHRAWFGETLESMLEPGGLLLVIGTRKHHDDIYHHLIHNTTFQTLTDDDGELDRAIKVWPDKHEAIYEKDDLGFPVVVGWDIEGEHKVLWPEERPIEWLLTARESNTLGYTGFAREYQHEVIDDESAEFKRDWLNAACARGENLTLPCQDRPTGGPWPERMLMVIGGDPAFTLDKKKAETGDRDYAAFVGWGLDLDTMDRYLFDAHRERGDSRTTKKWNVVRMFKRWSPGYGTADQSFTDHVENRWVAIVSIERNSAGQWHIIDVGEAIPDMPLMAHQTGREKRDVYVGVPRLSSLLEQGKVVFPYGNAETRSMVDTMTEEFHGLGVNAHDDLVMAIWIAEVALMRAWDQLKQEMEYKAARDKKTPEPDQAPD